MSIISGIVIIISIVSLAIVDKYIDDGPLKDVANGISVVATLLSAINLVFSKHRRVRTFKKHLKKFALFAVLIPDKTEVYTDDDTINNAKIKLVKFTAEQVKKRISAIEDSEIFSQEFTVPHEFMNGSLPVNQNADWKEHFTHQYLYITGKSGSGKSFEILKRARYACNQLEGSLSKPQKMQDKKTPVFVELKGLDIKELKELLLNNENNADDTWIIKYLYRTGKEAGEKITEGHIQALLEKNNLVYFFDGFDELDEQYWQSFIISIQRYAQGTGVVVTCRKEHYEEFYSSRLLQREDSPAEYFITELTLEKINTIIAELHGLKDAERIEMIAFIGNKENIREQLSRCIILNLFITTFKYLTAEEKAKLSIADEYETFKILWENYEDEIVEKKLPSTIDRLAIRGYALWIGKILDNQPFIVEAIQPHWLRRIDDTGNLHHEKAVQRIYYLTTRVLSTIIIGIAFGCIIATPVALLPASIAGGIFIALIGGIYSETREKKQQSLLANTAFTLCMIAALVLVCGAWQGLFVPRAPQDMTRPYFSITESWSGVLLGITLSTVFSYRIILERSRQQYILPVELFKFDWRHAIKYGLFVGFIAGLITGGIALYVNISNTKSSFMNNWLIPYLNRAAIKITGHQIPVSYVNVAIFSYAFILTFFVATILIVTVSGRYDIKPVDDDSDENTQKKLQNKRQKLNSGIHESRNQAFRNSAKATIGAVLIYALFMFLFDIGGLYHLVMITIGVGILTFLWFGGLEVINHYQLRMSLYVRGIAPLNYAAWKRDQRRMSIFTSVGNKMMFYHATLATYYNKYPLVDSRRIRIKPTSSKDWIYYIVALALFFLMLITPVYLRYGSDFYWNNSYTLESTTNGVSRNNDSSFIIRKNGILHVSAKGIINVGTFVGWVTPDGTNNGFMGMPLDSAYNVPGLDTFRHAALLMRIKRANKGWSQYQYANYWNKDSATALVHEGDSLQFIINDKEWQNNLGRFRVSITVCDTL